MDVYLLVDLNADSALGDIPDTSGATMVELMRHTLLDCAINLDVDVVSDFVGAEVGGDGNGTLLPEWPRERVSSSRSQTMTGRHFQLLGFFSQAECQGIPGMATRVSVIFNKRANWAFLLGLLMGIIPCYFLLSWYNWSSVPKKEYN